MHAVSDGADLRAAIAADPDAVENWLVYADWLVGRGDPRGEIIALELAIEAGTATEEAQERHRALMRDELALVSPRLADVAHHLELGWRRGFIHGATVFGPPDDLPGPDVLEALYADSHACVLRSLDLGGYAALHDAIATLRCDSVRELTIGPVAASEVAIAVGFPMLDALYLRNRSDAFDDAMMMIEHIVHPDLETLDGWCPALRVGRFDLPRLRTLVVHGCDASELLEPNAILARPPPALVSLSIQFETPTVVAALRMSPLCAQLRSLTLAFNTAIVEELARDPSPFRHLAIRGYGFVDTTAERDALVSRLAEVLPAAEVEVGAGDVPLPSEEAPPSLDPSVTAAIGDAIGRFVEKLRRR